MLMHDECGFMALLSRVVLSEKANATIQGMSLYCMMHYAAHMNSTQ
jgi:hypothetical protein